MKFIHSILILCALCWSTTYAEEHNHDEHAGHEHGEGKSMVLGDVVLGDLTLEVSCHGEFAVSKEFGMEIEIEKGAAPESLRAWVGAANGRGSVKLLLTLGEDKKSYHAHVMVPEVLPEDSKIWFEMPSTNGEKLSAALSLPKAGKKNADHSDEQDGKKEAAGHDDHDDHDEDDHDHADHKH